MSYCSGDRARFREKLGFDIIYSCFTRRELLHYVDLSHHPNAILDVGCSCGGNLIRFHAIPDSELRSSPRPVMEAFRDRLNSLGITATIRASRGEDIMAACGMLAGKNNETP